MSGFYILDRDFWTDDTFEDEPFTEREAWHWLIAHASYEPRRMRVGSRIIQIGRGQVAVSLRSLAETFGWSVGKLRNYTRILIDAEKISTECNTQLTIITLCNYDKFQNRAKNPSTREDHEKHTKSTRAVPPYKEKERERNKRNKNSSLRSEQKGADAPLSDYDLFISVDVPEPDPTLEQPPAASAPHKPAKPVFSPPDWVPLEPWQAFLEMRKAQKAPPTERAKELLVRKLDAFRSQGHDPTSVLEQSTVNAWKDLYEPKEKTHGFQQQTTRMYANRPEKPTFIEEGARLIAKYRNQAETLS